MVIKHTKTSANLTGKQCALYIRTKNYVINQIDRFFQANMLYLTLMFITSPIEPNTIYCFANNFRWGYFQISKLRISTLPSNTESIEGLGHAALTS